MSRIKDETAFYDGITAQLVIFENVNHTLLSSLRIRRKRGTGIKQQEISLGGEDENSACSVTPWEVHFSDMRWEGWLWAPSSYYANSCSGRCVTGEKECTFSSHAVVKYAYLKAKKNHGHKELKVNCSPYEYAPLTIQYINKHKHVKVKQVSHMRVVSCLCLWNNMIILLFYGCCVCVIAMIISNVSLQWLFPTSTVERWLYKFYIRDL